MIHLVSSSLRDGLAARRPRVALTLAVVLVGCALAPDSGAAIQSWCRTDPVVTLDGYYASVYLSAPLDTWGENNSSGDVLIEHPKDVNTNKVWEDPNGYFGQGVSTNFATNELLKKYPTYMEVVVRVRVPARTNDMPILVEWAPGPVTWGADGTPLPNPVLASVEGRSNQWIVLPTVLPYVS